MQQSYEEPVIKAEENEQTVDKALGGGKEGKVVIPAHNDKLKGWGVGGGERGGEGYSGYHLKLHLIHNAI